MNELYIVLILTVLFFYSSQKFLFYLINDKQIFFDNEYDKPQAFHNNKVTKVGGGIFIFLPIYFLILDNYFNFQPYLFKIFLTPLILLVIGLLSDLKVLESAKFRLALIIFATLFIVYVCKINIDFLKFNHGVFFYILQLFFISFVIISIINGSNFVDGLNGLLLSLTSIIFFFFIIIDVNYNNSEYFYFLIIFEVFIILLFFSNFPLAKIFLGDNGAYYIGCLIGLLTFKYLDLIFSLYPLLINIVIYPLMEVSFSLFRKLFEKKSPFLPDNLHLHMLVFNFNKRFINNLNKCNYISSAYIIIFLLLFYTFIYLFIDNPFVQHILSLLFIILYIAFYYVLRRNIQV